MKLSLNEEIATKAYQCHYARCSSTKRFVWCLAVFLFLVGFVTIIVIRRVRQGPLDAIDRFLAFYCLVFIWDLRREVFRDVHWKRGIKRLFDLTDTIDVETKWSDSQIEIKYGRYAEIFEWEDFKGWLETNSLLLLYRRKRKRFFDIPGPELFDVIDLSQISQEEKASFTEMLATKVNLARVPSHLLRVRLASIALRLKNRDFAEV